jgi:hypothetical protein
MQRASFLGSIRGAVLDKDIPEVGALAAHSHEHKELADDRAVELIAGDGRLSVVAVALAPRS